MRKSVVVVGSGMMGSGIAARAVLAHRHVILVDQDEQHLQAGLANAKECVRVVTSNGLRPPLLEGELETLLEGTADLEAALAQAEMVIEAVYENLALKQQLFCRMDALLPPAIPIASNTSGLRITDIAAKTAHPERTMTTHFWFPAHLVPLVEVVMSEYTSTELAYQVRSELERWGKAPVLVKRDLPGQLANRILQAVIREASTIVEMGLASPEDVDTAVKMGMGIRFPAWGPLEHVDGVGMDLCVSVQNTVLPGISAAQEANGLMKKMAAENQLGAKTGKGFYDWSVRDFGKLTQTRDHFIIKALKILQEDKSLGS